MHVMSFSPYKRGGYCFPWVIDHAPSEGKGARFQPVPEGEHVQVTLLAVRPQLSSEHEVDESEALQQ